MRPILQGIILFLVFLCLEASIEDAMLLSLGKSASALVSYSRKKTGGRHSAGYALYYQFHTPDGSLISGHVDSDREHSLIKIRYLERFPRINSAYSSTLLIIFSLFWFCLGMTGLYLLIRIRNKKPSAGLYSKIAPIVTSLICLYLYLFHFGSTDWFSIRSKPMIIQGEIGNSPGNLLNQGKLVHDQHWIYYSTSDPEEPGIYKSDMAGHSTIRLVNDVAFHMNLKDDWIYYINFNDNSYIYAISTDGKRHHRVLKEPAHELVLKGDWLFLIRRNDHNKLYRCDLKGNQLTKLNDDPCARITLYDDWIYYVTGIGDYPTIGPVYRIRNNGTERQPFLPDVRTLTLLADSTSLYFIPDTPERNLYRMSLTLPDSAVLLCDSSMAFINLQNHNLYFSSYNSGFIYRLDLSDRQITSILEQNCWNIYLADHWLYYRLDMMSSDDSRLHRIPIP